MNFAFAIICILIYFDIITAFIHDDYHTNKVIVKWNIGCIYNLNKNKFKPKDYLNDVNDITYDYNYEENVIQFRDNHTTIRSSLIFEDRGHNPNDYNRVIINKSRFQLYSHLKNFILNDKYLNDTNITFLRECLSGKTNDNHCNKYELTEILKSLLKISYLPNIKADIVYIPNKEKIYQKLGIHNAEELLNLMIESYKINKNINAINLLSCVSYITDDRFKEPSFKLFDYTFVGQPDMPMDKLGVTESQLKSNKIFLQQWHLTDVLDNNPLDFPNAMKNTDFLEFDNVVTVAVIDTGCYRHKDLWNETEDGIRTRFWKNPGESDCFDGVDEDGNGYIDDCLGWNFVDHNNNPFIDEYGHGTSVSSSIIAQPYKFHYGSMGMAPKSVRVMCLKAGNNRGLLVSAAIEASEYAMANGALITNSSFAGLGFEKIEYDAIKAAMKVGQLVVTAAGNVNCNIDTDKNCFYTPGAYDLDNILNVGSHGPNGSFAKDSCRGIKSVDIAAPGVRVMLATNTSPYGSKLCKTCFGMAQGTSFAAPMIAGAAALLSAFYEHNKIPRWMETPWNLRYKILKDVILNTAIPLTTQRNSNLVGGALCLSCAFSYDLNQLLPYSISTFDNFHNRTYEQVRLEMMNKVSNHLQSENQDDEKWKVIEYEDEDENQGEDNNQDHANKNISTPAGVMSQNKKDINLIPQYFDDEYQDNLMKMLESCDVISHEFDVSPE